MLPKKVENLLHYRKEILRDVINNKGNKVCRVKYAGFTLCYGRGALLANKIQNGEIWEEKMCKKIVDEIQKKPGTSFIDIGANIGLISLYVLSVSPNTKIYAFEPGPHQFEYFKRTITENKLQEKILLSEKAVGNRNKKTSFMTHFSQVCAYDGFFDTNRAGGGTAVSVDMITLDSWSKSIDLSQRVGVVKMDTEGAELWILQGALKFLTEHKPVIFLEIEPKNLIAYPYTGTDIFNWFKSHSYRLFTVDGDECTPQNFSSFLGKHDTYIARPIV